MQFNSKEDFESEKFSVTECINSVHLSNSNTVGSNIFDDLPGYPLVPSINLSTAHGFSDSIELKAYHLDKYNKVRYSRDSSALVLQLERYFQKLFGANNALIFNSGMSAISAALTPFISLHSNIHTIGNFYRKSLSMISLFEKNLNIKHFNHSSIDHLIKNAVDSKFNIVLIESPSNPFLKINDISAIKKYLPNSLLIYDVTLQGLLNGIGLYKYADFIVSSCTKYIGGHNDFLGGVLLTSKDRLFQESWAYRSTFGGILDNNSAYLLFRSLRTYDMRIANAIENCKSVLNFLENSDNVSKIFYPGKYENSAELDLFNKYFKHGGTVITFEVDNINLINNNLSQLKSTKMAPSFGSVDTLFEFPALMSHFNKTDDELQEIGLNKKIIRLSIGNEPLNYILDDLKILLDKK